MSSSKIHSMRAAAYLAAILAIAAWSIPARAADPIFPVGSRLGLVPPPGMVPSPNFEGFEDVANHAGILLAALPPAAYDQLDKSMVPDALIKQGIEVDTREPIATGFGKGFLLSGRQTIGNVPYRKWLLVAAAADFTALVSVQVRDQGAAYPEKTVRDALATLTARASVPDAERLSLLPFKVGDLAGFHIEDVMPGRALMLADTGTEQGTAASGAAAKTGAKTGAKTAADTAAKPAATSAISYNARMIIAVMPGSPNEPRDDDSFARLMFDQIVGIKDVHLQDAEPLRIGGQSGYQMLAKAKDSQSDTDVMVVQWLRFGTAGFLQMVGIARADLWPDMLTRLRTVRDSIDAK